ncbi:quinolinate synthase NadA [Parasporobacterium paucivorans]|uniref:Quinolinate synthase n=1 Tax=Parasporobacterium paucivorans DSM 15970 TaxID=1122934 RepID=A0A1M6D548_9FIRM|nr:quinolinate synthase NadA [Parasporobacterium paucivorans]SHI68241.1 quinolinate synthetase [Parasporobacterium paucivorans DSM 15970]
MVSLTDKINALKKEKDAVILAHYYVNDEVQEIADFVGDSYALAKIATTVPQKTILFCGVYFMGESAKILSPEKMVLMPDVYADCPMAHMADMEKIQEVRKVYDDLAVVCYVNSTAETKAYSDVCVTSSNALKIVRNLPQKNIYFIPDENLGRYVASQLPEKNFIFNDGFCHVHTSITRENVEKAKEIFQQAKVLVHPECKMDVLELADYIGSTAGIIEYATASDAREFIICTEMGILYELRKRNPDKKFYSVGHRQFCPNMKKITLEKMADALENCSGQVEVVESIREKANVALARMLELAE